MLRLLLKILRTPKNVIAIDARDREQAEIIAVGKQIHKNVKRLFRGSLAIRQVDAGSDNACEQELVALSNAFYDVERFGIHFVASPKHADMLLVTGPVTRNMAEALRRVYAATSEPKIVVACGDDAINGGIFKNSYAVAGGVDAVIPVHYQIPGDPPAPKTILLHILNILETLNYESTVFMSSPPQCHSRASLPCRQAGLRGNDKLEFRNSKLETLDNTHKTEQQSSV